MTEKDKIEFKLTEDYFKSGLEFLLLIFLVLLLNNFLLDNFIFALIVTIILTIIFYSIYGYNWFKEILFKKKHLEIEYYFKKLKKISRKKIEYGEIKKIYYKDSFDRNPAYIKMSYNENKSFKIKIAEDKNAVDTLMIMKEKCPNAEIEVYPDYCDVNFEFKKHLKND